MMQSQSFGTAFFMEFIPIDSFFCQYFLHPLAFVGKSAIISMPSDRIPVRKLSIRCNKANDVAHFLGEPLEYGGEIVVIDVELVKGARLGDAQCFAALYDQVATDLYKIALYTLGNTYDAEDVVSETFMEAYKGIRNLRDENSFRPWIMRILSIRCKRKIGQYIQGKQNIDLEDFVETPNDVGPETADCTDKVAVMAALDTLTPDERQIVILASLQGYTTREIGEMMDLPHGTVSSKLYRTLLKLRKQLEAQ